jgi:hypothetical protein
MLVSSGVVFAAKRSYILFESRCCVSIFQAYNSVEFKDTPRPHASFISSARARLGPCHVSLLDRFCLAGPTHPFASLFQGPLLA